MERPEVLQGHTRKMKTGCGNMYVTVNFQDGKPVEVFAQLGKAGGCASAQTEAIARLASLALQNGVSLDVVSKAIISLSCDCPGWNEDGKKTNSCADAIAQVLRSESQNNELSTVKPDIIQQQDIKINQYKLSNPITKSASVNTKPCPECGEQMALLEGCATCMGCGYSKCS